MLERGQRFAEKDLSKLWIAGIYFYPLGFCYSLLPCSSTLVVGLRAGLQFLYITSSWAFLHLLCSSPIIPSHPTLSCPESRLFKNELCYIFWENVSLNKRLLTQCWTTGTALQLAPVAKRVQGLSLDFILCLWWWYTPQRENIASLCTRFIRYVIWSLVTKLQIVYPLPYFNWSTIETSPFGHRHWLTSATPSHHCSPQGLKLRS